LKAACWQLVSCFIVSFFGVFLLATISIVNLAHTLHCRDLLSIYVFTDGLEFLVVVEEKEEPLSRVGDEREKDKCMGAKSWKRVELKEWVDTAGSKRKAITPTSLFFFGHHLTDQHNKELKRATSMSIDINNLNLINLVSDVDVEVGPFLLLLLFRRPPAREGVRFDLFRDLLGRVGEKDGAGVRARRHLSLRALQGGKELGVDQARFSFQRVRGWDQLVRNISGDSEVRVLVDGAWDQARQRGLALEWDWEA
jgi:hypothetical protein